MWGDNVLQLDFGFTVISNIVVKQRLIKVKIIFLETKDNVKITYSIIQKQVDLVLNNN